MNGAIPALVRATIQELVRSKLLYNLIVFAALLIGGSLFIAQLTIGQWDRIILDLGLGAIEVVGVLIAVLIGVGLMAGEIERRTIFPTLAKPVRRAEFLVARYIGLVCILTINVVMTTLLLSGVLWLAGYSLSGATVLAALLLIVETALVGALSMLFGTFTTPVLAAAFSLSLFLIGHLLSDLRAFGERAHSGLARVATLVLYRMLPDLELFNLKAQAANELPIPEGFVAHAALYGAVYTIAVLAFAALLFQRRDLK